MESRNAYIDKMKSKLDLLDARIDEWKAKRDEATADAKIKYQAKVDELKKEKREAQAWLEKVSDASEDAWDSLKDGFSEAYKKMKSALS